MINLMKQVGIFWGLLLMMCFSHTNIAFAQQEEEKVFDVVEQMPQFPPIIVTTTLTSEDGTVLSEKKTKIGGPQALSRYFSEAIRYPVIAQENGIQGRVICTFIVETDGSLSDVKVMRGLDPNLDREALRVMQAMPKWIPGKQNGKVVRTKYTVPVTFRLQ